MSTLTRRFAKTITVPPSALGCSFMTEVTNVVVSTYNGSCSQSHGYITDVRNIEIVEARTTYTTPYISVNVEFTATTAKPAVGNVVRATVLRCIKQGVMFMADGLSYRIFVPYEKEDIALAEGRSVDVEIVAVKYDNISDGKGQFNCIGKFVA